MRSLIEIDDKIGCVILTGRGKAFAAGADIKQMVDMSYADHHKRLHLHHWSRPGRNVKVRYWLQE